MNQLLKNPDLMPQGYNTQAKVSKKCLFKEKINSDINVRIGKILGRTVVSKTQFKMVMKCYYDATIGGWK